MTKPPPYQPTTQQMLAQAQAAQLAQQQAYHQAQLYAQQQLANQQAGGFYHGGYWYPGATTPSSSSNPAYITYMGANGTIHYASVHPGGAILPQPSPTVEEAGIRAGEITGVRAWNLRGNDELWSMYIPYIWQPGAQRIVDERVNSRMGNGFHAFKDIDHCRREYPGYSGVVYGEVALWGEVYEHERGYRAECARITRIIKVNETPVMAHSRFAFWRRPTIQKLRSKYGVVENE